ncbi:Baeyer-Villiger monooxygenase [Ceratobasidium sp. AG-Ba]|nr:Baeyer-Villiger monooxygenase [Ceratobasidium sp. AG-Ba]
MPAVGHRRTALAPQNRPLSAVPPGKPKPVRHRLTLQDKLDVIEFCEQNQSQLSQGDVAKVLRSQGYGTIVQSTISTWLEHKDEIRQQAKNPNKLVFKRMGQVEYPDVEEALKAWILQEQGCNLGITGRAI